MDAIAKRWKKLFLFGSGLSLGAGFCIKWIETDLWIKQERFTILGLEWFYSKEKLGRIMAGLDDHAKAILQYHLSFDFAFMAGIYPAIAALCMLAAEKFTGSRVKIILFILALLQLVAWACDIAENYYLLKWVKERAIGGEFSWYHFLVAVKWILAVVAAVTALTCLLIRRNKKYRLF